MERTILVYLMLYLVTPIAIMAEKKPMGNGLYWELNDYGTTLVISGHGEMPNGKIYYREWNTQKIKRVIVEEGVTSIGEDRFSFWDITSISLPASLQTIEKGAFRHCNYLTTIEFPNGISIKETAFEECLKLNNVIFPESMNLIGKYAFSKCHQLNNIRITAKTLDTGAFNDCGLNSVIIGHNVNSIGNCAFFNCKNLTTLVFEEGVTTIGTNAFYSCNGLASIIIPESVTSIGSDAFDKCSSLKSVTIPNGTIGNSAFSDCINLSSVTIGNGVTCIGERAFRDCSSLTSVTIPNPKAIIDEYAFSDNCEVRQVINGPNQTKYYICFKDDHAGLKNSNGEWTIPPLSKYSEIKPIEDNYLIVKNNYKYGLMTLKGETIIPFETNGMSQAGTGFIRFKIGDYWGIANYQGKIIIPTDRGYTSIGDFVSFTKRFPYTMAGYKGECDITGKQISKIKIATAQQSSTTNNNTATTSKTTTTNNSNNTGGTSTIVVEHHRDPIPVQEWRACFACGGMGTMGCHSCGGSGTKYIGDRLHRCGLCNGRGIIPCNVCFGNKGQYITVYK